VTARVVTAPTRAATVMLTRAAETHGGATHLDRQG